MPRPVSNGVYKTKIDGIFSLERLCIVLEDNFSYMLDP